MKALQFEKGNFTEKTIFVGGLNVHIYNSDAIEPYIKYFDSAEKLKNLKHENIPINMCYLIHGRGSSYKFTESIAYVLLKQYYEKFGSTGNPVPLVCITFDIPNHNSRLVNDAKNDSWDEGNATHGQDMISIIDTVVEEIRSLIDFIPTYLNPNYFLKSARSVRGYEKININYRNIISGYSLGAHASIRFAAKYPDVTYAINPVCGASDLTSLLLNRLQKRDENDLLKNQFYFDYDELKLSEEEKSIKYPESLHNHLSKQDIQIFENLPGNSKTRIFASFGTEDKVVPPEFSKTWIDMCKINSPSADLYYAEGVGHDLSVEMVDEFSTWLIKELNK